MKARALVLGALAAAVAWLDVLPARGEDDPPELLTAVPESPAFTFLGTTPADVARPAGARDFGLALINGVGPDGKVVNGFAVEATLWRLIPGVRVPLDEYQGNRFKYLLANTHVSLGTAAREGDPGATDLALGLKLTFLDRGDPMASSEFTKALGEALVGCLPPSPEADEAERKASLACVDKEIATRWARHAREHWNGARLSLALAGGWRFEESDLDQSDDAGFRAWLTGGIPLGSRAMGLAQATYRDQPDASGMPSAESYSLGARLLFGTPALNGFLEVIAERVSMAGLQDEDRTSWSVGADLRVATNVWISAGLGRRFESLLEADEDARTAVLANLKWGITAKSRIATLR